MTPNVTLPPSLSSSHTSVFDEVLEDVELRNIPIALLSPPVNPEQLPPLSERQIEVIDTSSMRSCGTDSSSIESQSESCSCSVCRDSIINNDYSESNPSSEIDRPSVLRMDTHVHRSLSEHSNIDENCPESRTLLFFTIPGVLLIGGAFAAGAACLCR